VSELATQIGVKSACEVLNVPRSQLYRHPQPKVEPSPRPTPTHALSRDERAQVRATLNREDVDYIMETFPIVKRKDEAKYGEYRTKRVILEMYDQMAGLSQIAVPAPKANLTPQPPLQVAMHYPHPLYDLFRPSLNPNLEVLRGLQQTTRDMWVMHSSPSGEGEYISRTGCVTVGESAQPAAGGCQRGAPDAQRLIQYKDVN